jgi:hypothetical protein
MRNAFFAALLVAGGLPAFAFSGTEHRNVSNTALGLVAGVAPDSHPLKAPALLLGGPDGARTFGDLTRMVDWYREPERYAALRNWDAIEDRKRFGLGTVKHLIAIHHNDNHFQDHAARAYATLHEKARTSAKDAPETALWYEAFALHYLQDFFAPGHIVSPRARNDDAAAAGLHDQFNRNGAAVIFPAETRNQLGGRIQEIDPNGALAALRTAFTAGRATFFGDGKLGSAEQFQFLVLLSALSIRDVFDAATSGSGVPAPRLALCFASRSALAAEADVRSIPVPDSFRGPFAAAIIPREGPNCECATGALARYDFDGRKELAQRFYSPSVWKTAAFVGTEGQLWYDLGVVVTSYDPSGSLRMRRDDDECSDDRFRPFLGAQGSFHATYLAAPDSSGIGGHLQLGHAWRWFSAFGYVGGRRYSGGDVREYRPYLGLKVVAGFEIVNVVVGVERAHRLVSHGFDPRYMIVGGAELNIPQSWIRSAAEKFLGQ